jgi:hypothetical protein
MKKVGKVLLWMVGSGIPKEDYTAAVADKEAAKEKVRGDN